MSMTQAEVKRALEGRTIQSVRFDQELGADCEHLCLMLVLNDGLAVKLSADEYFDYCYIDIDQEEN